MSKTTEPLWGTCKYCPKEAEAVVPVRYDSEVVWEQVCMEHIFGLDADSSQF
jgi:hypothetical protein